MASIPFVIDNQEHRLADVLNILLDHCPGGPLDIATAYFSVSGYRLLRERLQHVGALRLLIGSSNFTGPGLAGNRELNLVHRVLTTEDAPIDRDAAQRVAYLRQEDRQDAETLQTTVGLFPEERRQTHRRPRLQDRPGRPQHSP